jgi:hypothetical protein
MTSLGGQYVGALEALADSIASMHAHLAAVRGY